MFVMVYDVSDVCVCVCVCVCHVYNVCVMFIMCVYDGDHVSDVCMYLVCNVSCDVSIMCVICVLCV